MRRLAIVVVLALLGVAAQAAADEPSAGQPSLESVARGTLNRARRALAVGPLVGAGVGYLTSPGDVEIPISFGLGFDLFAVPVLPDPELLQDVIQEKLKERLKERLLLLARGGPPPTGDELERITREVADAVRAEVLGELSARARTFERPRATLALEGVYLASAGVWDLRGTLGIGISVVTLGPSLTVQLSGGAGLLVGGELAVHMLPGDGPRSPVVDAFVRFDYGVTDSTSNGHIVTLGARLLLDLI